MEAIQHTRHRTYIQRRERYTDMNRRTAKDNQHRSYTACTGGWELGGDKAVAGDEEDEDAGMRWEEVRGR